MKVCFITNKLLLTDGLGRSAISIIKELKKQGIEVKVLLSQNAPESDYQEVDQYRILKSLRNYKAKWFYLILDYFKAKKIVADCDLIHCEIEPFAPLGYLLSRATKRPHFQMIHGTFSIRPLKVWYLKGIFKKAYLNANKIFCNSNYTKDRFLKEVPVKNIEVVGRGVDLEKFRNHPSTPLGAGKSEIRNQKVILSVGIVKRRKGYHISIPAISQVVKKYPNLKYIIVGLNSNDEYFSELQKLTQENGLKGKVDFRQNLSEAELVNFYFRADICLLTSINFDDRFEGLGMVHLEANAASKPAIGTHDCGAQDAIKDGYNGLLVPQNDVLATSQAILKLLDNPSLAKEMGENGRTMVSQMTWVNVVNKIITNYKSVI